MAQHRKHPANCEKATGQTCKCGHCAGTQHGWVGAIRLVRHGTPEELRNFEQSADRLWCQECRKQESKSQKRPKVTLEHKRAAVDSARTDLIKRLREQVRRRRRPQSSGTRTSPRDDFEPTGTRAPRDSGGSHEPTPPRAGGTNAPTDRVGGPEFDPAATDRALAVAESEVEQVEALGHLLGQTLNEVEKDIGPLGPKTRQAMADHFWCELLVQLVVVIEESNRLLDSVPGKVAEQITKSRRESGLAKIEHQVITACAKQVWKRLTSALGLTVISDAKVLLPALRTLAVLMCKSPPRHPAVIEHCVDPLKALLIQETKKRLRRVFDELVPQITAELGDDVPRAQPG